MECSLMANIRVRQRDAYVWGYAPVIVKIRYIWHPLPDLEVSICYHGGWSLDSIACAEQDLAVGIRRPRGTDRSWSLGGLRLGQMWWESPHRYSFGTMGIRVRTPAVPHAAEAHSCTKSRVFEDMERQNIVCVHEV